MSLQDHEARELAEIEQRLAQDDPRLAARLTDGKVTLLTLSSRTQFILGVLATYVAGLLTIIAGVTFSSLILIAVGAVVTASFPVAVTVRAFRAPDAAASRNLESRDELAE